MPATPGRPPPSPSTSTTRPPSCTGISRSPGSTARPVAVLLRPGKTPSGTEIRGHLRRLVRRIRLHWPDTRLTIRGDSHYGRPAVRAWCEANGLDYIFGLSGNAVLDRLVEPIADAVRVRRAFTQTPAVRRYSEIRYGAQSWQRPSRTWG